MDLPTTPLSGITAKGGNFSIDALGPKMDSRKPNISDALAPAGMVTLDMASMWARASDPLMRTGRLDLMSF